MVTWWQGGRDKLGEITNKDLLYSTGNATQYSVMSYVGKESKKDGMCVCVCVRVCVYN